MASHPIVESAMQQGRSLLTETESKQILQDIGIATALGQLTIKGPTHAPRRSCQSLRAGARRFGDRLGACVGPLMVS